MQFGIGQPAPRKEDPRLLKGQGRFIDDIVLPEMLHGYVLRAPVAHGRIVSIDLSGARAAPGVHAVLSHDDIAERLAPIAFGGALRQSDGSKLPVCVMPRLASGKVRFVGQPVVWIVAETRDQARDAAEQVVLDIEDMPAVTDGKAALEADAPRLHDTVPGNLLYDWDCGDKDATEALFASAAHRVVTHVRNQRLIVNTMEPRGTVATYDTAEDRWSCWTGNQGAHAARGMLAAALKVPSERVRCQTPDVGGAFGMKLMDHPEYALAALSAKDLGRPVKWVGDRSESFLSDVQARDLETEIEGAFDSDGRLLAIRAQSISNIGAYPSSNGPNVHTIFSAPLTGGMYKVEAFHHRVIGVLTNTTPTDAYRGAGRPEAGHVTEQVIEVAAHTLGIDVEEIRRRNLATAADLPYTTHGGFTFDAHDTIANMTQTSSRIDREGFAARRAESESRGMLRGFGLCYYFERTGGGPNENARITIETSGEVSTEVGTQSSGQGHATTWAQIVHESLGVPFETISLRDGDTDALPLGGATGGSRSAIMASRVLLRAADSVIEAATERAADYLEAASADLVFDRGTGTFSIAGTDRAVALLDLAAHAPISGMGEVSDTQSTFPNGCHAAEVEIDAETGLASLLRYVITDDFGRLINPSVVAGQIHGGVVQGAGQILCEAAVWDADGQPLAASFMDYAMPRAADFPNFDIVFNEVPSTTNPLGIKGCGEAGSVGGIPTVALAIQDALRSRGITQIAPPYTPHNIWSALNGDTFADG